MHLERVPQVTKYLAVVMLFSYLGRSAVWYFLPIYIENHIASVFLVGVVMSLPAVLPVLLDIPVSNLVRKAGEKVVILMGLVAMIAPGLLYLVASPLFLALAKASEGLAKTLIWNGGWSLSLRTSDEEVEAETASVFLLGINLSVVAGPLFGGYVIARSGFEPLFIIWVFTAAIGVILFYRLVGSETDENFLSAIDSVFQRKSYLEELHDYRLNIGSLSKPLSLIFLYSIIVSFTWLAVPLLLDRTGAGFVMMGALFAIANLPWPLQLGWASLADDLGKRKIMIAVTVLLVPVFVSLGLVEGTLLTGGLFVASQFLLSGLAPCIHAMFDERVEDSEEGEMTGLLELVKHSGQAIGPTLGGAVASVWSLNSSFIGAGLLASVLLGAVVRRF